MLDVENLTLHYGQSQILNGIDLTANVGEVTAVMGTNGVGKTSLLKAISGRHPYSGGNLLVDGADMHHPTAFKAARAGVAYVPQGREIFAMMTVRENMETAFACLPKDQQFIPDQIFELFPVLKDMEARRGGDLSGGQQQQLAIARALITKPKVLLLDEPTEGIQPNIIQQIGRTISLLREQGEMAIVLVEQNFDFAYGLGDRFAVMTRGEIKTRADKADMTAERLLQELAL
ncbi:urea ABC transporter ATP-binding subunit UrtE [Yoonia sediminilitoris]|uniref:Amino acid/amide ABC transporter ATP-binding protein 2 (HAAT family) n=1 Tax=Yoonia sediminilitoris TaxID=1286148 RepID=A0A2T6KMX6_9RHOB|nr:urea ABC transporter ATP-binding subunit UrtE [Yoonia sediminilitoris]PUB17569.1 amino acid/amide ABC transporter ATP-binding protein 2 (HAAT family) [Yoonia sediminilitoris]RCW97864.1 amino acid/amide ABC transporter ATP-binding protein 2 (HAAT family) [Yoonia sediminilitoris]